jgi:hypothetical protein
MTCHSARQCASCVSSPQSHVGMQGGGEQGGPHVTGRPTRALGTDTKWRQASGRRRWGLTTPVSRKPRRMKISWCVRSPGHSFTSVLSVSTSNLSIGCSAVDTASCCLESCHTMRLARC